MQALLLPAVYLFCFWLVICLERSSLTQDYLRQLTVREVLAASGIALGIFAFSNLSFLYSGLPFTSPHRSDIFSIRTLVDFGGIAVLFAYQSRICDYMAEREVSMMNAILKSQYDQYRNYQDSLELIHLKYHDLKHQIAGLRMETDEEKRKKWIDAMEEEVSAFETLNKTGNQVLDICSIFGNAENGTDIHYMQEEPDSDYLCGRWKAVGFHACNGYLFHFRQCP